MSHSGVKRPENHGERSERSEKCVREKRSVQLHASIFFLYEATAQLTSIALNNREKIIIGRREDAKLTQNWHDVTSIRYWTKCSTFQLFNNHAMTEFWSIQLFMSPWHLLIANDQCTVIIWLRMNDTVSVRNVLNRLIIRLLHVFDIICSGSVNFGSICDTHRIKSSD